MQVADHRQGPRAALAAQPAPAAPAALAAILGAAVVGAAIVGAAVLGAMVAGCVDPTQAVGRGSLTIAVREAADRSLTPDGDFDPASYLVAGSGPEGAAFSVESAASELVVQDLASGAWQITVTGCNASGEAVAFGRGEAEVVAADAREVRILLDAIAGEGALEILLTWDSALIRNPLPAIELVSLAGSVLRPELTLDGSARASCSATGIPAAWYTMVVRLYDGDALAAGAAEAVLVRAGATTRGEVNLGAGAPYGAGSLALTLSIRLPAVCPLVMAGQPGRVTPLEPLTLETSAPEGGAQSWYLDGELVGAGSSADLDGPAGLGAHRLDAVFVDGTAGRAGSVSHLLCVAPSVERGILSPNFALFGGEGGVAGLRGARSALVSSDGAHLYASGYDADSVALFGRSASTGLLVYTGRVANGAGGVAGLDGPEGLLLSPDDRHLYVACYASDAIAVFARAASGALTFLSSTGGVDGPRSMAMSPDGRFLYAALAGANAVAVLARDGDTGSLDLVGLADGGGGGASLLESPMEIALSPDGEHLYLTAYASDAVHWFLRDAASGLLAASGAHRDGAGGVESLNGAGGLAVSPDGGSVLVASYWDRALTVFARDGATGALTPADRAVDGVAGVEGLDNARDVVVSPDGATVYVSGGGDDSVGAFRLDPSTLALSFLGSWALPDGPRGLALSPDGRSLYACSATAGALAALRAAP